MPKIHVRKVPNALVQCHGAKTATLISTLPAFYGVLSLLILKKIKLEALVYKTLDLPS